MTVDDGPPSEWYEFIKQHECIACGWWGTHDNPIEAAHFEGVIHPRTKQPAKRSHKGIAGWACVPLCRTCHLEMDGWEEHSVAKGMLYRGLLTQWLVLLLLEFFTTRKEKVMA